MTATDREQYTQQKSSTFMKYAEDSVVKYSRPFYKRPLLWLTLMLVHALLAGFSVGLVASYKLGLFHRKNTIITSQISHDLINSKIPNTITDETTTFITLLPRSVSPGPPSNGFIVLNATNAQAYSANLVAALNNLVNGSDWQGFGTSLSWWAQWIGGHFNGTSDFTNLMDAFFDVNLGLGLSVVRFNLGATVHPPSTYSPYVIIPAVRNSSIAPYDFDVDKGQRSVLLEALKRGIVATELFINSPPEWMTISGVSCGNYGQGNNLSPSNYQSYADYVVQTLLYYNNTIGVQFGSVAVFSEPKSNWWGPPEWCNQEGFHQDGQTLGPILNALRSTINASGLNTIVAGTDEVSYSVAQFSLNSMSPSDLSSFQRINVHGYFDPDPSTRKSFAQTAQRVGKKVWQSELGTGGNMMIPVAYGIREMGAIGLARNIIADIYFIGVTAWCYWQAMDLGDWGLYYCQYLSPGACAPSKQYYVMMQFSKWLRPGMDIVNLPQNDSPNVLLARSKPTNQLVIVALNQYSTNATYAVDVSKYALGMGSANNNASITMGVFRTSENENHALISNVQANFGYGSNAVVYLGNCIGNSVTTLVLDGLMWQPGV